MLTNLTSSGFVQFNRLSVLSSSLVSSASILIVSLSSALLSRVLFKLGAVGEIVVLLVVFPTKWKFSGLPFDWRKLVNPPGGYILKK